VKDTLVIHFSRTGYTRRIAEEIAQAAGADLEGIREKRPRAGLAGYFRSGREAWKEIAAEIEPAIHDPRDYRLVILGTPVWAGRLSSPVRAYIAAHKHALPHIALFCTQGGSGAPKVLQAMSDLCGQKPVATAVFTDSEIDRGRYAEKLRTFAAAVGLPKAA
jgi:flavodoxin